MSSTKDSSSKIQRPSSASSKIEKDEKDSKPRKSKSKSKSNKSHRSSSSKDEFKDVKDEKPSKSHRHHSHNERLVDPVTMLSPIVATAQMIEIPQYSGKHEPREDKQLSRYKSTTNTNINLPAPISSHYSLRGTGSSSSSSSISGISGISGAYVVNQVLCREQYKFEASQEKLTKLWISLAAQWVHLTSVSTYGKKVVVVVGPQDCEDEMQSRRLEKTLKELSISFSKPTKILQVLNTGIHSTPGIYSRFVEGLEKSGIEVKKSYCTSTAFGAAYTGVVAGTLGAISTAAFFEISDHRVADAKRTLEIIQ